MGFQVAVDPSNESKVYPATSMGPFRSIDSGRNFTNVKLPTGECAGKTGYGRRQFSNFVTDVVIRAPGGVTDAEGGVVLAAVGYRAGKATYPNGKVHSTHNGLYRSPNGAPNSFEKLDVSGTGATDIGFAPEQNIGRVEMGPVTGDEQDHNYEYAIVEDAELFNGGVPSIDVPEDPGADDQALFNTTFNGIYVSDDFGESWIRMADTVEVAENPATGSSLAGTGQAILFAPGVQAWYNLWIKPDPTRQSPEGVPTRLTFGLEEVWQNRNTSVPQNLPAQDPRGDFKVIGPYFADETCLLLDNPLPVCPTSDPPTTTDRTTHPDQHDALYIPSDNGGVSLVVGNDGGAYVQTVAEGEELSAEKWGEGDNDGFHTLALRGGGRQGRHDLVRPAGQRFRKDRARVTTTGHDLRRRRFLHRSRPEQLRRRLLRDHICGYASHDRRRQAMEEHSSSGVEHAVLQSLRDGSVRGQAPDDRGQRGRRDGRRTKDM